MLIPIGNRITIEPNIRMRSVDLAGHTQKKGDDSKVKVIPSIIYAKALFAVPAVSATVSPATAVTASALTL